MKTREWRQYLEAQNRLHGKNLFTVTELANVAGTSLNVLNVELSRLRKYGLIERYAQGKYGLPSSVTAEILLPTIDSHAYITGTYALHYHQLITQVSTRITCFTNRRHNRSRERLTPVGRYTFICVSASVYSPPKSGVMATPEQALYDFIYLMRRRGVKPETLVTFRNLHKIRNTYLSRIVSRYPDTVRKHLQEILKRKQSDLLRRSN